MLGNALFVGAGYTGTSCKLGLTVIRELENKVSYIILNLNVFRVRLTSYSVDTKRSVGTSP